jgi:hypothetical protein
MEIPITTLAQRWVVVGLWVPDKRKVSFVVDVLEKFRVCDLLR